MRCSAAAFLTDTTDNTSSAVKVFNTPLLSTSASPHPLLNKKCATSCQVHTHAFCASQTYKKLVSDAGRAFFAGHGGCSDAVHSNGPALNRSNRAPRPVTIRQLYAAVFGSSTESMVSTGPLSTMRSASNSVLSTGDDVTNQPNPCKPLFISSDNGTEKQRVAQDDDTTLKGMSTRIGESTILLDGAPCHSVVVCGRIVRCENALEVEQNILRPCSFAAPDSEPKAAYDRVWISDSTGLLCILRTRSRHTHAEYYVKNGALLSCFNRSEGDCALPAADAESSDCELWNSCFYGETGVATDNISIKASNALAYHLTGAFGKEFLSSGTQHVEQNDVSTSEEELYINDYVVCTGVLAFADVDLRVASALSRDADALRCAAYAATTNAAVGKSNDKPQTSGNAIDNNSSPAAAIELASQADPEYVLLPGSEVPLRLDTVRTELGLVGPLPAQTRYLTEREAQKWENGADTPLMENCNSKFQNSAATQFGVTSHLQKVPDTAQKKECSTCERHQPFRTCASTRACPLFCIKGSPRLLLDTNECLYWWLTATETHLRLGARTKH